MSTNAVQSTRPTIRKGEQCMSCVNKSQDEETDEGTIIICFLEERSLGVTELPFDPGIKECPSYALNPKATVLELEEEIAEDPDPTKVDTPELRLPFVFRGDSLVSIDEELAKDSDGVLRLTTSFVEKYNAFVHLSRQDTEERIDGLRAQLNEKLTYIKDVVKQVGEEADIDGLFMSSMDDEDDYEKDNVVEGDYLLQEDVALLDEGLLLDDVEYEEDDTDPDVEELAKKAKDTGATAE